MIFITDDSELKISTGIYGLYFYADWLLPHKKMLIMIDKVEKKFEKIKFYAIDTDSFKSACLRFKVNSLPTILVLGDGGQEIKRITGMPMTSAFKKVFADIYASYESEKIISSTSAKSGEPNARSK